MELQIDAIDQVIKNTIEVMEGSKYQIFEICESARSELDSLNKEYQQVMEETRTTIDKVDKLELDFRRARVRLTEVSRDFHKYREEDIKSAYEAATKLQLELTIYREKETNLKARRDELQKRIRNVERTIERAETLFSQMNVALEYLSGDLSQVTRILESAKNRQLLGLKIILAQEEERKRIAREIHDGPAQSLANLVLRSEIAERMISREAFEAAKNEISDLKGQVRIGLEEVRKVIFNLRPMTLDDLGIIPTLRKYAQDFEEKHKIRTKFDLVGREVRLSSALEVAMYRLVQEAFSNALKHADASHISLEVAFLAEQQVRITIHDNGVGFDPELMENRIKTGDTHFGIMGMRERVELLDGEFEIQSKPSAGTKLIIHIPIAKEDGKEI